MQTRQDYFTSMIVDGLVIINHPPSRCTPSYIYADLFKAKEMRGRSVMSSKDRVILMVSGNDRSSWTTCYGLGLSHYQGAGQEIISCGWE